MLPEYSCYAYTELNAHANVSIWHLFVYMTAPSKSTKIHLLMAIITS